MIQAVHATRRSLHDHLLVKRIEDEQAHHGGIVSPDSAKDTPREARVIAIGTGNVNDDGRKTTHDVKVGDRVLFAKDSGNEIRLGDKTYILMREEDVLDVRAS